MRALVWTIAFFVLVALLWALQPPLAARMAVSALRNPRADVPALEQELRRAGNAATRALRSALDSDNPRQRALCARLLALRGSREGDLCLLRMLRQPGNDRPDLTGAMAETFILSVWMERNGPPPAVRARVLGSGGAAAFAGVLERYPGWSAGYVARARLSLNSGEATEARHYALQALAAEPENFEALVVLARACLKLDIPSQAMLCLERAVSLNPRLKPALAGEIHQALKGLDLERARKLKEQRRREPLV